MRASLPGPGPIRVIFAFSLASFVVAATIVLGSAQGGNADATTADPLATVEPRAQPIAFSHAHHVAEIGLDCQMCHVYARRSPVAGIPSVEVCAGCHEQVLSDQPEVQRILAFWEDERPIPWLRVHDLPDHVRFTHKRHVLGGVDCAECHGDVAGMEIAVQVESLSMGWCVTCHQQRDASIDCLTCHY